MKIQEKMRKDWDRRAAIDPYYWVAATQEATLESYANSADKDTEDFLSGLRPFLNKEDLLGTLLDLGCGIGRMSALFTSHFQEVVGVDVSQGMIDKARELHSQPNLSFEMNSGSDLSLFEDETFDVVCSYSVLAHLPADIVESYFCEVGRVLKRGGFFRYQFWVGSEQHPSDDHTLSIHVYEEDHLTRLHQNAGLEECGREEIDYFDPILNLKPLWITAKKINTPITIKAPQREVSGQLSEEEKRLEYELMLYLAMTHSDRQDHPEAELVLERATHFAPEWPEAYIQWATLRIEKDDYKGSLILIEELTRCCPNHPQGWLFMAQVALAENDPKRALKFLTHLQSLDIDPQSDDMLLYQEIKREATQKNINRIRATSKQNKSKKTRSSAKKKKRKR